MRATAAVAIISAVIWGAGASAQSSQTEIVRLPINGVEQTKSVGEEVWSARPVSFSHDEIYVLESRAQGGNMWSGGGIIDVPAGSRLVEVMGKRGKRICVLGSASAIFMESRACVVDEDNDGSFEGYSFNPDRTISKLKQPVRYRKEAKDSASDAGGLSKAVLYLGMSQGSLSLSYREFTDNLARPAFTESFSIPLAATFPQPVRFKDVDMEILSIDGRGMRYRVVSGGGRPRAAVQ